MKLDYSTDLVGITIQDNGHGFDVMEARRKGLGGGFGTRGMEQRAKLLGGTFELSSEPDVGTTIQVKIPA